MVNYSYGKIYAIHNKTNNNIYIGSTAQKNYKKRFWRHEERQMMGEQIDSKGNIYDNMDFDYLILEQYPCSSRESLLKREQYYMDTVTNKKELILTNFNRCYGRNYHFDDSKPELILNNL
jgi:predicted GIY-YIG superfamily endonuclease